MNVDPIVHVQKHFEIQQKFNEVEFEQMVEKGTKVWADTPDDWVDELRGGADKHLVTLSSARTLDELRQFSKEELDVIRRNIVAADDSELTPQARKTKQWFIENYGV